MTPTLRSHLLVAACWLAATLVLFGDALPELDDALLGLEYVDHYGTQWFYWFVDDALANGRSLAHTELYFYPWGKDIFGHTGANVLDAILAIGVRRLFGEVLGYNLFVLGGWALTSLVAWLVSAWFTDDPVARGIGALWLALSPYPLMELAEGRPTQGLLVGVVLVLAGLWRLAARPGWKLAVATGLALALVGYQYWFYAFFCGASALSLGVWHSLRPQPGNTRARTLGAFALAAAVSVLVVAPVAGPLWVARSQGASVPGLLDVAQWGLWASPPITVEEMRIGLYLWEPLSGGAGFLVGEEGSVVEHFLERGRWLTWPMLLAWLGWLWRPGRVRRDSWLALALPALVLALGPIVLVGVWALPNPLYIALVKVLPFLQRLWWPGRAFAVLAVLLTWTAIAALSALRARPRLQAAVAIAATLATLIELRWAGVAPFPSWDATIPAGFRCLAGGEGAVIELPYSWTQAHLYYQSAHGQPILGGMLENNPVFTPEETQALREDNTWLAALLATARFKQVDVSRVDAADKAELHDLGYRYVLLQKDPFEPSGDRARPLHLADNVRKAKLRRLRERLTTLAGPPVWEDARVALHAPWGDGNPCAASPVTPDPVALGPSEVTADELLVHASPDSQRVQRLGVPTPEATEADQTEDTATLTPPNMPTVTD